MAAQNKEQTKNKQHGKQRTNNMEEKKKYRGNT